jgi:SAM-dependent methyltransferase
MSRADHESILAELVAAAGVDQHLIPVAKAITVHQYSPLYELLERHVPPGGHVLDWGCGAGHFSYYLGRAGYRATAFSLEEAPRICANLPASAYTFVPGDLANPVTLPFAANTFDAVASVGVLEHVREYGGDEIESLREIHRVLKPGGTFLCFHFPNKYSWIDAAARAFGRWSHMYLYTPNDIRRFTRAAGLELLHMRRYAALPRNVWAWGLPTRLGSSFRAARVYDRIDTTLSAVVAPFCQNHLFVARKPAARDRQLEGSVGSG